MVLHTSGLVIIYRRRNFTFRKRSLPFLRDLENLLLKNFTITGSVSTVKKKSATENRPRAFYLQISLTYHYTITLTRQNSKKFKDTL